MKRVINLSEAVPAEEVAGGEEDEHALRSIDVLLEILEVVEVVHTERDSESEQRPLSARAP